MRNIYLLFLALMLSVQAASSQSYDKAWWGVRGGVNFSNLSSVDYSTGYLTGYSVGLAYCFPISLAIPIYIESGLHFQKRGARDEGLLVDEGETTKFTSEQLSVPVLLGYGVAIADGWDIRSTIGLYYSVAVGGELEFGGRKFDPYSDQMLRTLRNNEPRELKLFHRSDFGVRVGVAISHLKCLFGLFYDASMINLYTRQLRDEGYVAQSGCFTMQIGYNF